MRIIKRFRRLGAIAAGLGSAVLAFALAAPAAIATIPPPPGGAGGSVQPAPVVRTVVVGGMPGWQIALITIGVAIVTAATAVLVDRARAARQRLITDAA